MFSFMFFTSLPSSTHTLKFLAVLLLASPAVPSLPLIMIKLLNSYSNAKCRIVSSLLLQYMLSFAYKVFLSFFYLLPGKLLFILLKPSQGIAPSRKPSLLLLHKEKQLPLFSEHSFFSVSASMSVIALFNSSGIVCV